MNISPDTKVYGIIGYPLTHSLSPIMHNMAFKEKRINGVYLYFPCKYVEGVVAGMKSLSIRGLSVTIPHKEKICHYVDELDSLAKEIGAANTLINKEGFVIGYNTDAYGAISALKKKVNTIKGKNVLIIGAGGAARAIAFALKKEGAKLTISNRTIEKGLKLADNVDSKFCPLSHISENGYDIIVQTTSVGMYPDTDKSPVSKNIFKKGMIVMDIIYNPVETNFLKTAKKCGCITISGIEMFIYQGAKQFELWTGKDAPIDLMKKTVLNIIGR